MSEQTPDLGGLNRLIGYQVRRVNARALGLWEEMLAGRGMAWGHYSILKFIHLNPSLIQKEIAAVAGIDQTTLTPIINHLAKAGLVERTRDPRDGRNSLVRPTEKGRALLAEVDVLVAAHDETLTAMLSEEERATLLGLLARVSGVGA